MMAKGTCKRQTTKRKKNLGCKLGNLLTALILAPIIVKNGNLRGKSLTNFILRLHQ